MTTAQDQEIARLNKLVVRYRQMLEVYRMEREQFLIILKEYSDKLKNEWFKHE